MGTLVSASRDTTQVRRRSCHPDLTTRRPGLGKSIPGTVAHRKGPDDQDDHQQMWLPLRPRAVCWLRQMGMIWNC